MSRPNTPLLFFFLMFFQLCQAQRNDSVSCPLDFDVLRRLIQGYKPPSGDRCQFILEGLRLVQSDYLKRTDSFLPRVDSAESCWNAYQALYNQFVPNFDIRKNCGFQTDWISRGCKNITSRAEYEANNSPQTLAAVSTACNQSLLNSSPCATCTTSLSSLQPSDSVNNTVGNVSDCTAYRSIYAAAFANSFGPDDKGNAECLFSLNFTPVKSSNNKQKKAVIAVVVVLGFVVLVLCGSAVWLIRRNKLKKKIRQREITRRWSDLNMNTSNSALESINSSTTLIRFTFDEIKEATKNFSRFNIIGRGGYGNVYKGVLFDGSEVALKRFKNCSAAGDSSFAHEVEVIASVRHVNLVALRGYCTATTNFEGHQRIIVCDLVKNGSLHDHLFGSIGSKLSWPVRQKIALGTARGLAYLHHGAQPSIIHRDIKGSNILLDEDFEPKVADFGLARFAPEGVTHVSTRVAGTMGYVAPEYALYGQLTERSDVYSFGIVLLELLSGKKALMMKNDEQHALVADWAWGLVRSGRALEVIEEDIPELGSLEVVEKYVLLAVLCSHPQLYARPTMDQVVKILDMGLAVPTIPERPIPLTAGIDDIEKSVSGHWGSGRVSSYSRLQAIKLVTDNST
ncbi:hypothetical protein DCAR_0521022 [Daucus carota subsp. sativus]|uniref:non-specific serine/threonine protein kinase n=2 Tax=Daucus carota subsp. sativus TaxID=79200 RepID=A0AAF0X4V6_DAUCS|nr:PREDICTED: probable LRR receptor-like serine/threonine-protein kinase RKF3 [Daucus carota subsp. sativus]WOH01638.1 hypothetical protein DCAR_0521022 [Daucus carota subsp. sativus]